MFDVVVLLALFQPMQFDDSFHHIIATNVYVTALCVFKTYNNSSEQNNCGDEQTRPNI
jgi:hypothetical protein